MMQNCDPPHNNNSEINNGKRQLWVDLQLHL